MEEAGLLADALKQLDEPFLVVVVGEFNSGKSTVRKPVCMGSFGIFSGLLPFVAAAERARCPWSWGLQEHAVCPDRAVTP